MKITTGTAKGQKILVPKHGDVRPTKDIVRQALFSMIGEQIKGLETADLYAGSGAVGLEALSRGAGHCDFVDENRYSIRTVEENLTNMHFWERAETYNMKVIDFFTMALDNSYDILFADPPYTYESLEKLIRKSQAPLRPGGLFVLEHATKTRINPNKLGDFHLVDQRKYGGTTISFFQDPRTTEEPQ